MCSESSWELYGSDAVDVTVSGLSFQDTAFRTLLLGQSFWDKASAVVRASISSFTLDLRPLGTMISGAGRAFVHAVQPFINLAKVQV
jgi:hypothetical protein